MTPVPFCAKSAKAECCLILEGPQGTGSPHAELGTAERLAGKAIEPRPVEPFTTAEATYPRSAQVPISCQLRLTQIDHVIQNNGSKR